MKKNQVEFTTVNLVGSLFVSDSIANITQRKYSSQKESDYRLPPGIKFSDQTSRAFAIAKALYVDCVKKEPSYDSIRHFVLELFRMALDYTNIQQTEPTVINGVKYPVSIYLARNVPIVIAPSDLSLDSTSDIFTIEGATYRKKSAFALAQMFLNASDPCTWAIVTNGRELRLLRDSESLVRPSYLSFDIESILKEDRYPDFVAFWSFMQSSRAESSDATIVWEKWRNEGILQGTRVREGLRVGVTNALLYLGAGFIKNPANNELRTTLERGVREVRDDVTNELIRTETYNNQTFYKALLREVYRFLFLSTLEERGLIFAHPSESGTDVELNPALRTAHKLYNEGYSIHRLAERAKKAVRSDAHTDLWKGVKVVYRALSEDSEKDEGKNVNKALDLMPLGGLFNADQCPLLDKCELDNEHLMKAIKQLRWNDIDGVKTFTDYRNMGTEEFGSVYESLLELVPQADPITRTFSFVGIGGEDGLEEDGSTKGNARKLSGSYYTDSSLVQSLIKTALEPAIDRKLKNEEETARREDRTPDYEKAILSFRMIDAGSGSGHFLLAGSRRLAEVLSEKRLEKLGPDANANADTYRKALRDVITNCIYGVDINDMAIELARTALWLEGYEPGKPLEFLNHHIKCGNSVVGVFDLSVLNKGIPDAAYTALTGDDKAVCSTVKKQNSQERGGKQQTSFFDKAKPITNDRIAKLTRDIEGLDSDSLKTEQKKRDLYEKLQNDAEYIKNKAACDLYTAAFFATKKDANKVPTSKDVYDVMNGLAEKTGKEGIRDLATSLSTKYQFFHWPIEFPEVFRKREDGSAGFDCVVGNPPWDRVKLQEKEFFAQRDTEIAEAKNKAKRDKMIDALATGDSAQQQIYADFIHALHNAEATSNFVHVDGEQGGRFDLTGTGDVNLYALFAELNLNLRNANGTSGFVCPSGIATDDSTKAYFGKIAGEGMLKSLYDFENRDKLFATVDSRFKFCLLTIASEVEQGNFSFFLHNVNELDDKRRHFTMSADDFKLLNPNTLTCPVFRSKQDSELAKKIYKRSGVFINEKVAEKNVDEGNPWHIDFMRMFDMSNDSNLFSEVPGVGLDEKQMLPLYEAKMMHQMDHRWATFVDGKAVDVTDEQKADVTYSAQPEYWVPYTETVLRTTRLDAGVVAALRKAYESSTSENIAKLRDAVRKSSLTESNEKLQKAYADAATAVDVVQTLLELAEEYAPKYLMGYRNISNATNSRTFIASVIPFCGVGHSALLFSSNQTASLDACLIANIAAMPLDYIARLKLGGTNMTYGYVRQFPILKPNEYSVDALNFIVPRVFALTYTANDIVEWARALYNDASPELRKLMLVQHPSFAGVEPSIIETLASNDFDPAKIPPVVFNDAHRAKLRAELDAYFAKLYGLNRDELQYILDPAKSSLGADYPSETFRVLRDSEISTYGEYRTERLVLEAWDRMN